MRYFLLIKLKNKNQLKKRPRLYADLPRDNRGTSVAAGRIVMT
jgi:hypothetical protein